ncbi:MAG: HAMP domain-containing histidine kinase [Lachnospiraceae bacterium]|nr:HAMP domain-containing histidine kinase [Lachnospiraceae bacterium]
MKRTPFIVVLILAFVAEIAVSLVLISKMENDGISRSGTDPVLANECVKSIEENFGNEAEYRNALEYALIDTDGELLYKNAEGVSVSLNEAVKNGDTILDITNGDTIAARLLIRNKSAEAFEGGKKLLTVVITVSSLAQILIILGYFLYLKKSVVDPFKKLNSFASRVAEGNLDVPLDIDRGHIFGSFTEAFDIMRSELKKSRAAEKKANDEKKEVIAKLSHDIKTPIASIKSSSEIGYELTGEERTKELFGQINIKVDQITALADNLFHSSINDITEIDVKPSRYDSAAVTEIIKNADYLSRSGEFDIPDCRVYIDRLRLQQAFDNVFMNSYKYANTEIEVSARLEGDYLTVRVADFGEGVREEELPLLKEKYRRGSNAAEKEGAGLGLYLTDYFLEKMNGRLVLERMEKGFSVLFYIRLA